MKNAEMGVEWLQPVDLLALGRSQCEQKGQADGDHGPVSDTTRTTWQARASQEH